MGWDVEYVANSIMLSLDSHGGEKEREHVRLAVEFRAAYYQAIAPLLRDPRYREILAFDPEYYLPEDVDTTPGTNVLPNTNPGT